MKLAAVPPVVRALAALGFVLALGALFDGRGTFWLTETHGAVLRATSVTGILAIGMTFVILTGGIDLSVGSVLGLAGMVFAGSTLALELPPWLAVPLALLAGALCGALNGALVARLGLQAFLATLATMVSVRGLAKVAPAWFGGSAGTKIMPPAELVHGTPFQQALAGHVLGVPVVGLVFLATACGAAFLLHRTVYGRHVYAVGGNLTAAHFAGVHVARVQLWTYTLCGALAGLAAVCQVAQSRLGDPEAGTMFELKAIAAVVIGGTLLTGGRGGIALTVLGALTIGYIEKILSINGVREHWRLVVQGAIIVAAVLLQARPRIRT